MPLKSSYSAGENEVEGLAGSSVGEADLLPLPASEKALGIELPATSAFPWDLFSLDEGTLSDNSSSFVPS